MKATILLFHRTNPVRDKLWDPMDPKLFDRIINYVSKNFTILPLDEICLGNPKTKKKLMSITFDDGYKDYIDYALPILDKYKIHSTMFIVTSCVQNNLPPWTYILDHLFINTNKLSISNFEFGEKLQPRATFSWATKAEQLAYSQKIKPVLKTVDNELRNKILDNFIAEFKDVELPSNLMMTWEDVKSLDKNFVSIGSHTLTHPALNTIENDKILETELKRSAQIIQNNLGVLPNSISYPLGKYNQRVKDAAKDAGYKIGLVLNQKAYNSQKHDMFEIPRLELYNGTFLRNKIKVMGIESSIKSIFRK
jgi:peptidoglycan/xylan/chitin deacetylase (PgdA/CDA1 family)